jgi:hypothetical protein
MYYYSSHRWLCWLLLGFFWGLWLLLSFIYLFIYLLLRVGYYAISNLSSKTYSNAPRHWILELENLKLDLAMMLAVEVPD